MCGDSVMVEEVAEVEVEAVEVEEEAAVVADDDEAPAGLSSSDSVRSILNAARRGSGWSSSVRSMSSRGRFRLMRSQRRRCAL